MKNQDLLIALRRKSKLAFEFIYKSYYVDMLNFAHHYVMNRSVAEDIVHDVYSKLWEMSDELPNVENIKSYLFTMVKNSCMNHFKHCGVVDKNQSKVIEAVIFSSTYDYLDNAELEIKIKKYLELLPDKQREVIELRYFEDMKYAEIAEKLDVSTETVHTHLKRAMLYFKNNVISIHIFGLFL